MNNQLKKYYLMTDESMKKLREINEAEKQFSTLDQRLKKILYNKRLSGHNKYILYSQLFNKLQQLRAEYLKKYNTKNNEIKSTQTSDLGIPIQTQTEENNTNVNIRTTATEVDENANENENTLDLLNSSRPLIHRRALNRSIPINNRRANRTQFNASEIDRPVLNASPILNATSTPIHNRSPANVQSPARQYRDPRVVNDSPHFEPNESSEADSYETQLNESLPDFNNLAINEPPKSRDPFWMSHIDWEEIMDTGMLEAYTPEQNRRLSVASMVSAQKKRAVQQPTYSEEDGAVGGGSNEDQNNMTIIDGPPSNPHVTISINDVEYSVPVADEDDFREFAAEEVTKDPNIMNISRSKFVAFQKRKNREYHQRMKDEAKLKRKVEKREQKNNLANELAQADRVRQLQIQENNWDAHNVAAASTSTPKTAKKKTPKSKKKKAKTPSQLDKTQPSVAEQFQKVKNTPNSSFKQAGSGNKKKVRWVELK